MSKLESIPTIGGERIDAIEHCLAGISRLQKEVQDATSYITSYDQEVYSKGAHPPNDLRPAMLTQHRASKPCMRNSTRPRNHSLLNLSSPSNPPSRKTTPPSRSATPPSSPCSSMQSCSRTKKTLRHPQVPLLHPPLPDPPPLLPRLPAAPRSATVGAASAASCVPPASAARRVGSRTRAAARACGRCPLRQPSPLSFRATRRSTSSFLLPRRTRPRPAR